MSVQEKRNPARIRRWSLGILIAAVLAGSAPLIRMTLQGTPWLPSPYGRIGGAIEDVGPCKGMAMAGECDEPPSFIEGLLGSPLFFVIALALLLLKELHPLKTATLAVNAAALLFFGLYDVVLVVRWAASR